MAAVRHVGYQDYEFGDRDLDSDGSGPRYYETDRDAGRLRVDSWHNEVNRQENSSNWHHNNHSNRRGPSQSPVAGSRRGRLLSWIGDREPGKVSSRSGSEDHREAPTVKDNGAVQSLSKKRKFSPIVWGGDAAIVKEALKGSKLDPVSLPIPHFPDEAAVELPVHLISGNAPRVDVDISVDSPQHVDSKLVPRHGEDEIDDDAAPTRLISMSRWADEGEEDGEVVWDNNEAEVASSGDSSGRALRKKVPTPELGVVVRGDSSGGGSSRSSGSGSGLSESVVEDGTYANLMDFDHSDSDDGSFRSFSDIDSEDDGGLYRTEERAKTHRSIEKEIIFRAQKYMERDLKGVMETMKQPYSQGEVKHLMLQLLEAVQHLHDKRFIHRDLKTSNLLLNYRGQLEIRGVRLSRQYGSPLKPYIQPVGTLWYRAPELLLGAKEYSPAIDMWSVGCIMAELLTKEPLFPGKTEFDQLNKIFEVLGTPNEKIWPAFASFGPLEVCTKQQYKYNSLRNKFSAPPFTGRPILSEEGLELLNMLLTYDPEKRITAEDALKHFWFYQAPLPSSKVFLPTFPALNEHDRCWQ